MKLALSLFVAEALLRLVLFVSIPVEQPKLDDSKVKEPVQVWMVWESACIKSVSAGDHTWVEAPMNLKTMQPETDKGQVHGVLIEFKDDCGHLQVRRKK